MKQSIVLFHDKQVGDKILSYLDKFSIDHDLMLVPITTSNWKESYDDLCIKTAPKWLREMNPDWVISAWWPKIICSSILQCAKHTLNIHNSFLPWCRGKHPNFWSIVEQSLYGVTLHEMTSEIDGGRIYCQETIPITWEDTGATLHAKSLTLAVDLFIRSWPAIFYNSIKPIQQNFKDPVHCSDEIEEASHIKLDGVYSARQLLNIIRARSCGDYKAWFEESGVRYKVDVKITKV